jgi:hypothetical protein
MLFQQTAAPTGWTKQVADNNKALRIVSGTVGSGGSVPFSTLFGRTATDAFTLAVTHLAPHAHTGNTGLLATDGGTVGSDGAPGYVVTGTSGNHMSDYVSATVGSGTAFSMGIDMRVQYVDVIIAAKN